MPPKTKGARKEKEKETEEKKEEVNRVSPSCSPSSFEGSSSASGSFSSSESLSSYKPAHELSALEKALDERVNALHKHAAEEFTARAKTKNQDEGQAQKEKKKRARKQDADDEEGDDDDEHDDFGCGLFEVGPGLDWEDEDEDEAEYDSAPETITESKETAKKKNTKKKKKGEEQKKTKAQIVDEIVENRICPIFISSKSFGDIHSAVDALVRGIHDGSGEDGGLFVGDTQRGCNTIDDLTSLYSRLSTVPVFKTMPNKFFVAVSVFGRMIQDDHFMRDNEDWVKCGQIVKKWHDLLLKMLREHTPDELCMSSDSVPRLIKLAHSKAKDWNKEAKDWCWAKNTRLQEE